MSATDTPRTEMAEELEYLMVGLPISARTPHAAAWAIREICAANARADDLQTRLDNLRQNYSDAQQMLDAVRVDAGKWRTRCKEAQRCMREADVYGLGQLSAWGSARDAGKDE